MFHGSVEKLVFPEFNPTPQLATFPALTKLDSLT